MTLGVGHLWAAFHREFGAVLFVQSMLESMFCSAMMACHAMLVFSLIA